MATTILNSREAKPVPTKTSIQLHKDETIGIIGVGYVGKHLLEVFSSSFRVIGYDLSSTRVQDLRRMRAKESHVQISNNEEDLGTAKHFLIAVPTTLDLDGHPNLSHIISATKIVERYARPGSVVVIESTVAIGTTRVLLESLARSLKVYAGMSPEVCLQHVQIQSILITIYSASIRAECHPLPDPFRRWFLGSTMLSQVL